MAELNLKEAMQLITAYSSAKSEELDKFFYRNEKAYYENGETSTLYEDMILPNIVLRLMDNRDFKTATNEVKREMIYNDYYPEESKTDYNVYLDDRWNLCQELHNKLCKEYNITPTLIKFVNFKDTEMDYDCFEHYNPIDGIIYMNSLIDYSNCETTELAERVCQATFMHQLHMELRKNFFNLDKIDKKQRYILLSTFNKMFAFTSLSQEKAGGVRRSMEFNDGYSTGMVYSIFSTYEYLNKMFTKYKLLDHPMLRDFNESRVCYLESLLGEDAEEDEDEEYSEFGYDEEDYEDEIDVEDGILYDTIGYDLDILYTIDTSVLNENSHKFVFNVIINEMDKCASDFYEFFGNGLKISFKDQYFDYKDSISDEDEDEMEEDAEIDDEDINE